jgi:hypothetical protein
LGTAKKNPHYRYLAIRERMAVQTEGNALIQWHRQRCGDSEKVHHVEKSELAGGQLPSQKFGENAAGDK